MIIALDWGTSSLRAFLMDAAGNVVETRHSPHGILRLPEPGIAGFRSAFTEICGDWIETHGIRDAVACGMVGSAQGWAEAPYVACPADVAALAGEAVTVEAPSGVTLRIAPGVSYRAPDGVPDVMRGEEIQIAGILQRGVARLGSALVVLPGTHSKWVGLRDGRIERFTSYMTGEVYAALSGHTILGRLMTDAPEDNGKAFLRGVRLAKDALPGDFAHQIFSARTLGLFGEIEREDIGDYLSGIVIGHELVSALQRYCAEIEEGLPFLVVGEGALSERYRRALSELGQGDTQALGNTAPEGLHRFAVALELFG